MTNYNPIIYKIFYVKKDRPIGLLSWWKNIKNTDLSPKIPPFPVRLHRQIAGGIDDELSLNINSRNLWNVNNNYLHRELRAKYPKYITSLSNKKTLDLLYKKSNLRIIPIDVVYFSIGQFI